MSKEANKGENVMSTVALNKTKNKGLTQPKKEAFKQMVGKYSTKIDLNKVRNEWKDEKN